MTDSMPLYEVRKVLRDLADRQRAGVLQVRDEPQGDDVQSPAFLGILTHHLRKLAKQYYHDLTIRDLRELLRSPVHEERLLGVLTAVRTYVKGDKAERKKIYDLYMKHTQYMSSLDLVDESAEPVAGRFLLDKSKRPLYQLAKSGNWWERRIAIVATRCYIKRWEFVETLKIAQMLLSDEAELVQKAVGWMLREVGNLHFRSEEKFLMKYYKTMPKAMLRYAIESFPESKRRKYLKGEI